MMSKVTRTRAAILLPLLLTASLPAFVGAMQRGARPRVVPDKVSVRARGLQSIVVTERGRPHRLDLTKYIDAARIEDVSALFLTRKGDFTYLLLEVCGMSKEQSDDRQCGAGVECNVVWLKLDGAWRARDAKSERYESCWSPITADEGPKVEGRRMKVVVDDLREEVRREVTYDADNPESGLTVRQSPIPKTTP
jgi:hypothetical protein